MLDITPIPKALLVFIDYLANSRPDRRVLDVSLAAQEG
jgi:hypothetical protein